MEPHALGLFTTGQLIGLHEAVYADASAIYGRVAALQSAQYKMTTWTKEYKDLSARITILIAAARDLHQLLTAISGETARRHADARQYSA